MQVFQVMGGIDYEGDHEVATFTSKEEATEYRNFLEFNQKMGNHIDHYDYYFVMSVDVYNSVKEFEAYQARMEREQERQAFARAEQLAEESRTINNPFIEALGDLK